MWLHLLVGFGVAGSCLGMRERRGVEHTFVGRGTHVVAGSGMVVMATVGVEAARAATRTRSR
jgi:hypothetical protein